MVEEGCFKTTEREKITFEDGKGSEGTDNECIKTAQHVEVTILRKPTRKGVRSEIQLFHRDRHK